MLNKLCAFIRQQDLVQKGEQITCAVSGGADSMALLFAMYLLKDKLGVRLSAAHFNHNLRGEESDADEAFVREFCDRYDIPLYVGSATVVAGEKGLEAAARDARYGFFATLPGKIATAHTADDNAETVLLHLVRGTGLKGLGGIAPSRDNVIRPMLHVTRQEVLAFLEEYYIPYRTDSSNDTDAFLRNRLRHHVMPLLKAENPSLAENLSAMALRLRLDEQALQAQCGYEEPLNVSFLRNQPTAIRIRTLEQFLKNHGVKEPEASHLKLAEELVFSENPSAFARFPGNVTLCRRYDELTVHSPSQPLEEKTLSCPGRVETGEWVIECAPAERLVNTANVFTVCADGPITVRSRRSGDTIRLSGGTKTLKKLFIDRKIPASCRSGIPVLEDARGLLAVAGIGVDQDRAAVELPAWQISVISKRNVSAEDTD